MLTFSNLKTIAGPLLTISNTENISYGEIVSIKDQNGSELLGQVVELNQDKTIVQMFSSPAGFQTFGASATFEGKSKTILLSPNVLGSVYNGKGEIISSGVKSKIQEGLKDSNSGVEVSISQPYLNQLEALKNKYINLGGVEKDILGSSINPYRRREPDDFIQTGISSIDLNITLVKGQKLPIFSASGLPSLEIMTQIATRAKATKKGENFAIVVAAMGITNDQLSYLNQEIQKAGSSSRTVMFVNMASDPVVERVLVPKMALTTAEYLAFELDFTVLSLIFDLTSYAGALREISVAKKEIPGRSGYPGYLYTDLANMLERAGVVEGKKGSITQIPILTMPNDDITHPVPDLVGYITEGQIVLDRSLHKEGIFPCIDIQKSLSRLKDKGQGDGKTRDDHSQVADQIFALVAESKVQEDLAMILGEDSLSDLGRQYLKFGKLYKTHFLNQKNDRSIQETLDLAWEIMSVMPREALKKLKDNTIKKYCPRILEI